MSDLFCFVLFFSLGESLEVVGGGGLSSALFINLTSPNLWVKKTPKQLKNTASRGTTATDKEASKARTAPERFFFFFLATPGTNRFYLPSSWGPSHVVQTRRRRSITISSPRSCSRKQIGAGGEVGTAVIK